MTVKAAGFATGSAAFVRAIVFVGVTTMTTGGAPTFVVVPVFSAGAGRAFRGHFGGIAVGVVAKYRRDDYRGLEDTAVGGAFPSFVVPTSA